MKEQFTFDKQRISCSMKVSKDFINEAKITSEYLMIQDELAFRLDTFVYQQLLEEKELVYYFQRPKFFEWLLRKPRTAKFKFVAKETLTNPPKMDNTRVFYNINPIHNFK